MAQPSPSPFSKGKVVDVHTHMYPPEYVKILESRTTIPLVRSFSSASDPRLILLEAEVPLLDSSAAASSADSGSDSGPSSSSSSSAVLPGRPLTQHYSSLSQKIHFMDTHGIDISVLSLANPWLDFLPAESAGPIAHSINSEFSAMCAAVPGRLFFFAALPLTSPQPTILSAIAHAASLPFCRGVILGTSGLGAGLDDPALLPIFSALAASSLTVFLHPHYGLPNAVWGPRAAENYGHVLPLALGFPMETTIAVTRMFLAAVFDTVPCLQLLLAHSGGTLPFLAGRIESCIAHDGYLLRAGKLAPQRKTLWEVLQTQIYLDAVVYSDVGIAAAVAATSSSSSGRAEGGKGEDRLIFGTDHPFFPPLETGEHGQWESVSLNVAAVKKALGEGTEAAEKVMGGNAVRVLRLYQDEKEK
ncbi:hypothetical protein B0H63DRAFT_281001 [Podospora didyma]|uniref:Amidohydrolase-related domain-containing protein n=1 Tax=Podospora didyma TaxID=330526 RepID=A0AAE0N9Y2_9PEZI|nr:hypothetical protein B0H63DRAFT_281001 [Podospora didyma]